MLFQSSISLSDLRFILITLLNEGHYFALKLRGQTPLSPCIMLDYMADHDHFSVQYCEHDEVIKKMVLLSDVESMTFDFFYRYKNRLSRSFKVT